MTTWRPGANILESPKIFLDRLNLLSSQMIIFAIIHLVKNISQFISSRRFAPLRLLRPAAAASSAPSLRSV